MSLRKKIVLTEQGVNSGPQYGVYISPDGNTWTFVSNVTLPSVGSSAVITVQNNTTLVRLTSIGVCNNSIIQVLPGSLGGDFNIDFSYFDFNVY